MAPYLLGDDGRDLYPSEHGASTAKRDQGQLLAGSSFGGWWAGVLKTVTNVWHTVVPTKCLSPHSQFPWEHGRAPPANRTKSKHCLIILSICCFMHVKNPLPPQLFPPPARLNLACLHLPTVLRSFYSYPVPSRPGSRARYLGRTPGFQGAAQDGEGEV